MQVDKLPNDEVSLYSLITLLFRKWYILAAFGVSFGAAALTYALFQPNIYRATVLMMPAESSQNLLSNLGGLAGMASMAGISLPDTGKDKSKLAVSMLESYGFITDFIAKYDLIVPIMAAEGWDMESDTLLLDPDVYDKNNNTWVRQVEAPFKPKPSLQEAYREFKKILNVEQDPETKFYKLSIDYYSPKMAAQWANAMADELNAALSAADKQEAADSVAYLEDLMRDTNLAELRSVFSTLMEEQIKAKMLTEIKKDYAMKIVDAAFEPEVKDRPKRLLIGVIAGFFGGIIGIIVVFFRAGRP